MAESTEARTEKGPGLARGPALAVGTILLIAGLYMLYRQHTFPKFSNFPNGDAPVDGKVLGIFGANGWTGMLTAVAGGLLLFGAAQHLLAKTMSLIVGVALGAAAIIALVSGNVLGMAAANGWTEIAWGVVAVILLFNTLTPRRRTTVATGYDDDVGHTPGTTAVPAAGAGAGAVAVAEPEGVTERDRVRNGRAHAEEPVEAGRADSHSAVSSTGGYPDTPAQEVESKGGERLPVEGHDGEREPVEGEDGERRR